MNRIAPGAIFVRAVTAFILLTCVSIASRTDTTAAGKTGVRMSVPIVFTSRAGPASLVSVPPAPEERFPGGMFARAIPGKLRLLKTDGTLVELTWRKRLADGSSLIDVMSPSVSLDGTKVVFAAIKHSRDHFRLYEVKLDGTGLRQLTGLWNDPGCIEPPYLRLGATGRQISDRERKRVDYDDLDPAYLPDGRIVFSSTRLPRKALYGNHRVTNLWVMNADGSGKHQITYNLSGERWPYVLKDGRILYSYWSRTLTRAAAKEILSGRDEKDLEENAARLGRTLLTAELPNNWWPAVVNPDGTDFRALSKPSSSALRTRPLFNGRLVYSTQDQRTSSLPPVDCALAQIEPGYIGLASGGRVGSDDEFPSIESGAIMGPGAASTQAKPGNDPAVAPRAVSPSPVPGGLVVFSFASDGRLFGSGEPGWYDYALYTSSDDWLPALGKIRSARKDTGVKGESDELSWSPEVSAEFHRLIGMRRIFDEPGLCEADAQAVYARKCLVRADQTRKQVATLTLANGKQYKGPTGGVSSPDIYANSVLTAPGQRTDTGESPVFAAPPRGLIKAIDFYAARLTRDDRGLAGGDLRLEKVVEAEVSPGGGFAVTVPAGVPLMQFGKDADGNLATWSAEARDSRGRKARLSAFAGDHFGYAPEGVPRSFCVGCHAGHTVLPGRDIADLLSSH